ncbi:MAG: FecR family protein, partial [Tannerella sp.]|nr:FecR family protein [Tannerella sp.]
MINKEKEDRTTDVAWEQLYRRVERDGLLPGKSAPGHPSGKTFTRAALMAVAVAVVAAAGYHLLRQEGDRRPPQPPLSGKDLQVIRNEANAPTLATVLDDGSIVYLSEQTSLKYPGTFDGDRREVVLQGDAFFEIRKNAEQPFFIDTEPAVIEVAGTSFQVRSGDFLLSV